MTRKQMINKLGEFLQTQSFTQGNWPTADNILVFLEDQGMAPPLTTILPNHYNRTDGQMGFQVHEWDEE